MEGGAQEEMRLLGRWKGAGGVRRSAARWRGAWVRQMLAPAPAPPPRPRPPASTAAQLRVATPVKVCVGPSWGELQPATQQELEQLYGPGSA